MVVSENYTAALQAPESDGVAHIRRFLDEDYLRLAQAELNDPARVAWRDNHSTFVNRRGLTIVQNHDVYALQLQGGDPTPRERIPELGSAAVRVSNFVDNLGTVFPALLGWQPHELSLHRYDDTEVGLSFHRDHPRFVGVIAILALEGECDLAIRQNDHSGKVNHYPTEPGDLVLLRAPGLVRANAHAPADLRPEHAVLNLRTPTRTSMMLRKNLYPGEPLPGFTFDN